MLKLLKFKYKFSLKLVYFIKKVNEREIELNQFIGSFINELNKTFYKRSDTYSLYNVTQWVKRLDELRDFYDNWYKVRVLNKILHELYDWADTRLIDEPDTLICYVY